MRVRAALGTAVACAGVAAGAAIVAPAVPSTVEPSSVDVAVAEPAPSWITGSWPTGDAGTDAVAADAGEKSSTSFVVADAIAPSVELFAAGGVTTGQSLPNPTKYELPLVFRVMEDHGPWLDVQVPARPNGRRAFIRSSDVTLRTVPHWIKVELGARKVTVLEGYTAIFETTGAVGKATTATPTGWFYVDASVLLTDATGPYGSGQLALSGFSEVYTSWGGGDGQIALHGTNANGLLGQAASNGCVRLDNAALLRIQDLAPTGTPVLIVP